MDCPRCRISTVGSRCPNCGDELAVSGRKEPALRKARKGWSGAAPAVGEEEWRRQLRSALLGRREAPRGARHRTGAPRERSAQAQNSIERPLFDYKPPGKKVEQSSRRKVVAFTGQAGQAQPAEKPLIRRPVHPTGTTRSQPPKQGVLTLDAPLPSPSLPMGGSKPDLPVTGISHEIMLSRMLAGMIDILIAASIGAAFGLLGSFLLGLDFFSEISLRLSLLLGLCFFFLNSFFFLLLSGQTLGMYWTDLKLIGDESESVPFQLLMLRICLFLPVALSVVGLLSSVFDPWCRCLHDRLSRTRVVPLALGGSS